MKIDRNVQQCRWAEATLFLAAPQWLDAWDYPWSCRSSGAFRPIPDTRVCRTCERWQARDRADSCCCSNEECK
jgi:hypothetical protein